MSVVGPSFTTKVRSRALPLGRVPWLLGCMLVAAAAGCGPASEVPDVAGKASAPALLDQDLPRLNAPAHSVVPASAGIVDLVCALLPPERVAALPAQALRYSGLRDTTSPHLARPTFGLYETERILALEPDLVLVQPWQSADTTARLREAGIPVVILPEANTWPEIRGQLLAVAGLLDAEPEGRRIADQYDRKLLDLERSVAGRPRPRALCYSNGGAGGWAAGADTTNHEALGLAGLENAAALAGHKGHTTMTYEELLLLDPDVIVVGGQADAQQPGGTAELLRDASALSALRAVREGRILVLDSWLYTTTSHHLVDAAVEIARLVEPFRDAPR